MDTSHLSTFLRSDDLLSLEDRAKYEALKSRNTKALEAAVAAQANDGPAAALDAVKAAFSHGFAEGVSPVSVGVGVQKGRSLLATGLHVLPGDSRSGKTFYSYALASALLRAGYAVSVRSLMEPGGQIVRVGYSAAAAELGLEMYISEAKSSDERAARAKSWASLDKAVRDSYAAMAASSAIPEYTLWLNERCAEVRAAAFGTGLPGVLILDSLTYLLRALDMTREQLKGQQPPTFTGGISAADTLGAIHHNLTFEQAGVICIATLNSSLYPVAVVFEGAAQGIFSLEGNKLFWRSRSTKRENVPVPLQLLDLQTAAAAYDGSKYVAPPDNGPGDNQPGHYTL